MKPGVIGITGFKNTGKTTLVERLVAELRARGHCVSTIKHAHHSFDIDHKGRDSYRHRMAGAHEVAVLSRNQWAIIRDLRNTSCEPSLEEVLARLSPCDIVIVEGYKRDRHAKIEMRDITGKGEPLAGGDPTIVAIVANGPLTDERLPVFQRDNVTAIADFILKATRPA